MRIATAFVLLALFAAVQSFPVEIRSTDTLRHDPSAHDSAHADTPSASMEHDSEPEMTGDMPAGMPEEDKEKPAKEDKEVAHDAHHHDEEGHEGHGHDEEGHEGHDHDEEGHEGHGHDEEGHKEEGHEGHGHDEEGHKEEGHEGHGHGEEGHEGHGHDEEGHESEQSQGSQASPVVSGAEDDEMPEASAEVEEGVCIGATHLERFESHELVFENHVLARVLCDTAGSCATTGHIVNYKGTSMMMGRYCDIVGCEQKVMEVNSPRYQRGLKIPSVSDGMHFTAFAARFETRGEEAVLAAAVRAGL